LCRNDRAALPSESRTAAEGKRERQMRTTRRQRVRAFVVLAAIIVLTGCERQVSAQSEREALSRLCNAPSRADRERRGVDSWIAANVTQPHVVWLYVNYKTRAFEAAVELHRTARNVGIEHCELIEPDWANVTLPEVSGNALPAPRSLPFMVVGRTQVGVAAQPVIETKKIGDGPLEFISEIRHAVRAQRSVDRAVVIVDEATSFGVLTKVLWSAAAGGVRRFSLVARKGNAIVAFPLELPKHAPPGQEPPLVVVSSHGDKLHVWSLDSQDGTMTDPSFILDRSESLDRLTTVLESIVSRRYKADVPRSNDERTIILALPPQTLSRDVVNLMSHVQLSATGVDLFPNVVLGPLTQ
jgi:hypothetical protein